MDGCIALSLLVEDIMARDVITIEDDFSVKYGARMMSLYKISSLVVLSGDKVVGILTERDITSRVVAKGLDPEKVLVKDAMSYPVLVVNPTTSLEEAVKMMFQKRIKKLPVMNDKEKASELLGILSITDVARIQPKMFESLREIVQFETMTTEIESNYYVR